MSVKDSMAVPLSSQNGRDNALFARARALAVSCAPEAELEDSVLVENASMAEPLPEVLARAKAASAWRYKAAGRLMHPGSRAALMDLDAIARCAGNPVAFPLLAYLRTHHSPEHLFAVVPEAVARILGQSHNTVRKARDKLIGAGYLALERSGGGMARATGYGITNLYRLTNAGAGHALQNLEGIE